MPEQDAIKLAITRVSAHAGTPIEVKVTREQKPPVQIAARDNVQVDATAAVVIEVLRQGAQGPPGVGSDKHYTHTQALEADTWTVTHGLGKRPAVQVFDASNRAVLCEIEHVTDNQLILRHSPAMAGYATFN